MRLSFYYMKILFRAYVYDKSCLSFFFSCQYVICNSYGYDSAGATRISNVTDFWTGFVEYFAGRL